MRYVNVSNMLGLIMFIKSFMAKQRPYLKSHQWINYEAFLNASKDTFTLMSAQVFAMFTILADSFNIH